MTTTFIYALSDPRTDAVRYIGKSNDPEYRYKLHIRKTADNTKKSKWVRSLLIAGVSPTLDVIDEVPNDEWSFWEQHWIQVFKGWGFDLVNGDNGGLGSGRIDQNTAKKISATLTGRENPRFWREIHCYSKEGIYIKSFASLKQAAKETSTIHSNIIKAVKSRTVCGGYLWSYELVEQVVRKEKPPITEATLHKIRLANAGRKASQETKLKQRLRRLGVSPANKGIPATEEQKRVNRNACTTKRKVTQCSLNGEPIATFDSVKQASIVTGATRCGISKVIKGISTHAGGYLWIEA